MLEKLNNRNEVELYEYFVKISHNIPFYYSVNFDLWYKCMLKDCSEDGILLFKELETYVFYEKNVIKGFIQFGISNFTFEENGKKDYGNQYGIIRNLHFCIDSLNPEEMLDLAIQYFSEKEIKKIHAFFHYFGMSCYARNGKLHESNFHIENLLNKYSFRIEHENIVFSRNLENVEFKYYFDIYYKMKQIGDNKHFIEFLLNDVLIGFCEIVLLQNNICYLLYFTIIDKFRNKGFGKKCINNVCFILKKKNIAKIDVDTIDKNVIAQKFYLKNGFIKKGNIRSYFKED